MAEIHDKAQKDLIKELAEKREALRAFRFSTAGTRVRNVREGRAIRKDIARILTELNARTKREAQEA